MVVHIFEVFDFFDFVLFVFVCLFRFVSCGYLGLLVVDIRTVVLCSFVLCVFVFMSSLIGFSFYF